MNLSSLPSLYFESVGRGPDVVLVHGWGLHGGVWSRVAQALADEFTVHCVDLPGHGHSVSLQDYTLDNLARALAATFPLPVQVVGWSLGGLAAMRWALDAPASLKSLTLVASSPCFVQRADWPHAQAVQVMRQFADNLGGQFEQTLRRFLALQTLGSESAHAVLAEMKHILFAHGRPSALEAALAVLESSDVRHELPQLHLPTHLSYGQRDALTPIGAARWLAGAIAGSTLTEFPQASHAPFLSHEAEFVADLIPFLQRHA